MGSGTKQVFRTALTDVKDSDLEGVGTVRHDEMGRIYRWVKNVDATAFTAKQPVCWDSATNKGTTDYYTEVTLPVTAELMNLAGIAVTAIGTSGSNCYGWVQVFGHCTDARIITPATGGNDIEEGSELIGVNTKTYLAYQGNAGTAPIYSNHIISLEAVATATGAAVVTKDVMIKCF